MKVKTSGLAGAALDWAVTYALHGEAAHYIFKHQPGFHRYSTDWAQGGPIIEREKLCIDIDSAGVWLSWSKQNYDDEPRHMTSGLTPLIAAMRCYISSRLGAEVEVPNELD